MSDIVTMTVRQDIPELGVKVGDVLVWDARAIPPLSVQRDLQLKPALLVGAFAMGALEPLCPLPTEEIVARLLAVIKAMGQGASAMSSPEPRAESVAMEPIDIDAALRELESPTGRPPREQPAAFLLHVRSDKEASDRFIRQRDRYKRRISRTCGSCGVAFSGVLSGTTCDACKAARKKRCVRCGEVFTAEHTKEKRCVPCLEKAAAAGEKVAAELLRRKQETG